MARLARIKFHDPTEGYYHVTSRTVLGEFLLEETEKEFFLKLLKKLSNVYFVKVETFAILSNHFHIVFQMIPSNKISDKDLRRRFELYYNENVSEKKKRKFIADYSNDYRKRFEDISCFVQDLKQRFSRWYNKGCNGHGTIWAERFKSVILDTDRALLACMVYVELNAVRAGMVKNPEDYRYCGLHHYVAGGNAASWLDYGSLCSSLKSVQGDPNKITKSVLERYLKIIYVVGTEERTGAAEIPENDVHDLIHSHFADLGILSFRRRIRYFSDGVILGSKSFCEAKFKEFHRYFKTKKERTGKVIAGRQKTKINSPSLKSELHLHSIRSFQKSDIIKN